MTDLDTRPQVVNIDHYAGDTLTLHINIAPELIGGRTFKAQARSKRDSPRLDAEFEVRVEAWGADVILLHADCQRLAKRGKYDGFWDVQLAEADGSDPVVTIAHGELRIHSDVTRTQA
jgi:hypothetical protein